MAGDITLTMEVVLNVRYGGFSLTRHGTEDLLKTKGLAYWPEDLGHGMFEYWLVPPNHKDYGSYKKGSMFRASGLPRNDPDLVNLVKDQDRMRAAGTPITDREGDLEVRRVTINVDIDSHDGKERVHVNGGDYGL